MLLAISCPAGLLIATLGTTALLSLAPADLPRLDEVSMNRPVLAFAMGLSALVAIALGLITAVRAAKRDPRESLADGARGQAGGASSQRVGRIVVATQMAMTVVLLIGAALLGRSLLRVLAVDPGFRTDGIVAMDLALPYSEDPQAKARLSPFYAGVFDRLRGIPGVEEVAAANAVPMDGGFPDGLFLLVAPNDVPKTMGELAIRFRDKDRLGTADYGAVSPAYFRALGIPLIRGRLFDDRDAPDAPHVAVINESLARSRWRDADPIGATIEFGNMDGDLRPLTVVGVVGDTREYGLERPATSHAIRRFDAAAGVLGDGRHALERRSARDHRRCAHDSQRGRAGCPAALPHVRADLRRLARSAALQPHPGRRVCRNGARPGRRRHLRRDDLHRHAAPPRDWRQDGARRQPRPGLSQCPRAGAHDHGDRRRRRHRRGARPDADDRELAVRGEADGSGDVCRGGRGAGTGGDPGVLPAGPARDQRRPDGGAAAGVAVRRLSGLENDYFDVFFEIWSRRSDLNGDLLITNQLGPGNPR